MQTIQPGYEPRTDPRRLRAHGLRNRLQTVVLLIGMAALLGLCGWLIAGLAALVWLTILGGVGLFVAARVSPNLVLRMFRAVPLSRHDFSGLYRLVEALSARAGLSHPPALFFISSRTLNAFSVGDREQGAICITGGMLHALNQRELAGVLAHELCHLANNDTRVMALADVMARLTRVMSLLGVGLLLLNLPLIATGGAVISWTLIALLTFAPTIVALMQLALSRTREFDADLDAAGLTGDPHGLAQALAKLERRQGAFWEDIFTPGRRIPDPSLLRTHPKTEDRIARLLALAPATRKPEWPEDKLGHRHGAVPAVHRQPRWHRTGVWY